MNAPSSATRRHLIATEALAAAALRTDQAPGRRSGNGLRIHGIYFLVVSLAALGVLIGLIAAASAM